MNIVESVIDGILLKAGDVIFVASHGVIKKFVIGTVVAGLVRTRRVEQDRLTKKQLRKAKRICHRCGRTKWEHPHEACREFVRKKR